MPNPGQELASIDFASMIGGPLLAPKTRTAMGYR